MEGLEKIIYYTGWCVWYTGAICIMAVAVPLVYHFILKPIGNSLTNLRFYFFGKREWKNKYLELWQDHFAHKSGIRKHWKERKHFRRLAYIRLLKEARKEIHAKHN